jgi:hypothetical protein
MKWYNKNKTKYLETNSVSFWEYYSKESQEAEFGDRPEDVQKLFPIETYMHVVTGGGMVDFYGEEAEEIYNILRNQKTVLHS